MRWELFLLDLRQMFSDFRAQDFGSLVFWGLWLGALFASLRGVDRRDEIAQLTYMGTIMAIGVVLILILPFGVKSPYGPLGKVVVFSILLLCPSVRWLLRKRRSELDATFQEAIATKKSGKSK
jgi:peptidoglycan/LPS O-acetylase OafA/YrhL